MKLNQDAVRKILLFIEANLGYEDKGSSCPHQHETLTNAQIVANEYFKDYQAVIN